MKGNQSFSASKYFPLEQGETEYLAWLLEEVKAHNITKKYDTEFTCITQDHKEGNKIIQKALVTITVNVREDEP